MSWSAASLSSIMSYSSTSSVGAVAAATCPPPPLVPAPGRSNDDRPLSPALAITVMGAVAPAVCSSGGPPSWEPVHGAATTAAAAAASTLASGGTAWTGGAPAAEAFPPGGFPVAADDDSDVDDLERAAAGDAFGRTSPPSADRKEARLGDAPVAGPSDGHCLLASRGSASSMAGDGVGVSDGIVDGETEPLPGVMRSFQGAALSAFGDCNEEAPKDAAEDQKERERGARGGGPTQVLGVPVVGARDTDECLGIQVRHRLGGILQTRVASCHQRGQFCVTFEEDDSIRLPPKTTKTTGFPTRTSA